MRILPLVLLCSLLSACNLVRGVGQDMAAIGRTLTKVSGTHSSHSEEHSTADTRSFDDSYLNDQAYAEPAAMPPDLPQ